jgi:hypothetical protein
MLIVFLRWPLVAETCKAASILFIHLFIKIVTHDGVQRMRVGFFLGGGIICKYYYNIISVHFTLRETGNEEGML